MIDRIWLSWIKGNSIGWDPIKVSRKKILINIQYINWLIGYIMNEFIFILKIGKKYKIIIDISKAITPPSFLGIERRIAYANKKYHSGWIWTGVIIGLAGIKLSGSPKI